MKRKESIKIIVADDDKFYRNIIVERIEQEEDLEVVKSLENGDLVYEEILKGYADVAILDMIMPHIDGLGVLEKLSSTNLIKIPKFIFLSGIDDSNLTQRVLDLGASYYLKKPFDLDLLVSRIRNLVKDDNRTSVISNNDIVDVVISFFGISEKLSGYKYIKMAIEVVVENNGVMDSITKIIYPKIARKYNTTDKNVERNIRNCIEQAYSEGRLNIGVFNLEKRPTNSEFIKEVAKKVMNMLKSGSK